MADTTRSLHSELDTTEKVRALIDDDCLNMYNVRTGEVLIPDWSYCTDECGDRELNGLMTAFVDVPTWKAWHDEVKPIDAEEDDYGIGDYALDNVPAPMACGPNHMGFVEVDDDLLADIAGDDGWVVDTVENLMRLA